MNMRDRRASKTNKDPTVISRTILIRMALKTPEADVQATMIWQGLIKTR